MQDHYYCSAISVTKEKNPKYMQDDNDRKYFLFAELVILVVKENGALSEADGYYCTYSFGGRLDILWLQSTSMRRTLC